MKLVPFLKKYYLILIGIVLFLSCGDEDLLRFPKGTQSLSKDLIAAEYVSADSCKDCHKKEYSQWSSSMHKKSFSNVFFQKAIPKENRVWCIYCHTPLYEQVSNFKVTDEGDVLFHSQKRELLSEGINCAACHVRGDVIYSSKVPGLFSLLKSPHKLRYSPFLRSPEFCAGCHEFSFPESHFPITYSDFPMQSTYTEWKKSDQKKTCQNCHFPKGNHDLPGPHQKDFLKSSLQFLIEVRSAPLDTFQVYVELKIPKIGHHFLTGDLFRSLSITAFDKDQLQIGSFIIHKNVSISSKKIISDTTIHKRNPEGELYSQISFYTGRSYPKFCKIVYHYQGEIEKELLRENMKEDELRLVLYSGTCQSIKNLLESK